MLATATAHLDLVRLGVSPVHLALLQVQGQAVGPAEGGVHQHVPLLPIQVGALDFGVFPPVRPVHEAGEEAHVRESDHLSCPLHPRGWSDARPRPVGGGQADRRMSARPPHTQGHGTPGRVQVHGALGLKGPAGLISVQQVSGQQMPDEGPEGLSAEREDKAERDLLQRAEGLPCAKQVTLPLWPQGTKLDPGMGIPGQGFSTGKSAGATSHGLSRPGPYELTRLAASPTARGSSELGGTSEAASPSPISQTMAVRPAEAVTRQSSVATSGEQLPSRGPLLGALSELRPPRGSASHPRPPPNSRHRAVSVPPPHPASPLTSLGFGFPRCTAVLTPRVTGRFTASNVPGSKRSAAIATATYMSLEITTWTVSFYRRGD